MGLDPHSGKTPGSANEPIPSPTRQQTLKLDRGKQLIALRNLRVGSQIAKHLLRALDDHLGNQLESFTISVATLASECEISTAAADKWLRYLDKDLCLIRWDSRQGRMPTFRIIWKAVFDRVDSQGQPPMGSEETHVVGFQNPPRGLDTHTVGFGSPPGGSETHHMGFLYKEEAPLSAQYSAIEAPPPSSSVATDTDRKTAVKMMVKETGVKRFGTAVDRALRHGLELDQIADIVRHFEQFPGRWSGGVLFDRLTREDATLLRTDEGWYGDDRRWVEKQIAARPHVASPPSAPSHFESKDERVARYQARMASPSAE